MDRSVAAEAVTPAGGGGSLDGMGMMTLAAFRVFSPTHLGILAGFLVVTGAVVAFRRGWDGTRPARILDRAIAAGNLVLIVAFTAWWLMPARFDRIVSLPLHVCDLAGVVAAVALWTDRHRWRVILHYWGLGLCTQGIITPALREGPDDPGFWLFWASHFLIIGAALYDVFARGFRPRWRDYGFAAAVTIGYLLVMLPVDILFDLNYGYLGQSKPDHPSIIEALGPWPGRVMLIVIAVAVVFFLMTWPWELWRSFQRRESERRAGSTAKGASGIGPLIEQREQVGER